MMDSTPFKRQELIYGWLYVVVGVAFVPIGVYWGISSDTPAFGWLFVCLGLLQVMFGLMYIRKIRKARRAREQFEGSSLNP